MVWKDKKGKIQYDEKTKRNDDIMCALCGIRRGEQAHHLMAGRADRSKADKLGLIAMLCHRCHDGIHNHHIGYEECEELAERAYLTKHTFKEWFSVFHINRCEEIEFDKWGNIINDGTLHNRN